MHGIASCRMVGLWDSEVAMNIVGIVQFEQWPWHRCEGLDTRGKRTAFVHHFRPSNPMDASTRPVDTATQLHRENQTGYFAVNSSTPRILDTELRTPYDFDSPVSPRGPERFPALYYVKQTEDISIMWWVCGGAGFGMTRTVNGAYYRAW